MSLFKLRKLYFYIDKRNKLYCYCCHLLRDAPRARMTGSVISIIDCRVEVTTMKRMILRRKVRCSACISSRPVWRARRSRVTPSVTPLTTRVIKNQKKKEGGGVGNNEEQHFDFRHVDWQNKLIVQLLFGREHEEIIHNKTSKSCDALSLNIQARQPQNLYTSLTKATKLLQK